MGEVLIPLRHCWRDAFSVFALAVDRFVTIGRRTAHFCFGPLMRCLFLGSPPFMFLSVTQWSDHCVFWQIFLWVFLFGLLPLSCVWLLFLLTKRKSGLAGGFAGRLACVCVRFVCFVVICLHFRTFWVLVQMRFLLLMLM